MKLNQFIINSIVIIILIISILYICLLFNQFTFIKNNTISKIPKIPNIDIVKQINDEPIDSYKIIKPYDYFVSSQRNITLYEPFFDSPPMLASGSNKANVSTIDNMRTFLEQMYAVTSKDETKDASYNFCNKFAEIASTLPSVISDLRKLNREEIYKLYSSIAIPTPPPSTAKMAPQTQPVSIPIIQNNNDYVKLLELCIRSHFLPAYVLPNVNINNKLDRKVVGEYDMINATNLGVVDSANAMFMPIKDILNYFHNQYTSPPATTPGDIAETASLSLQDSCASNSMSFKIKQYKRPGIFKGTVPEWANSIQILIIGAGGGGGGGALGCDAGNTKRDFWGRRIENWSSGGGGGSGGNTGAILYTTQKYIVAPNTSFECAVGAGGWGGESSGCCKDPNKKEHGGQGGNTEFSINNSFLKVVGASGGVSGSPGHCGYGNSQRQYNSESKIDINLKRVKGEMGKIAHTYKESIQGSGGKAATVNSGRVWHCWNGENGTGNFISQLPEIKINIPSYDFSKYQRKYGYGGHGGKGQTQTNDGQATTGKSGGSGYICIFFFAD